MGLFDFLRRMIFGAPPSSERDAPAPPEAVPRPASAESGKERRRPRLKPSTYAPERSRTPASHETSKARPYEFAMPHVAGHFLNLSTDANEELLRHFGMPRLTTPADIATWLNLPLERVAWLAGRFYENHRPDSEAKSHYVYRWRKKRSGGHRLIEAPKPLLKLVQQRILGEILDRVPAHPRAFGFVAGRSATMNAAEHVGQYVVLKLDLSDFYASVRYSRVVAIFRSVGFSRVAALWLARLTTSAAPSSLSFPDRSPHGILPYLPRHLPQGAPTSPALANLSAYSLDVRLAGLAKAYHAAYSRYADDLTFSGSHRMVGAFPDLIPLIQQVVRQERFGLNRAKRKIIRRNGRQTVTGIVVNERLNISREEYDRLKAILHNCVKLGPKSQNRNAHPHFADHLLGRVAHVASLNPARGEKLRAIYAKINWSR